MNKLSGYKAITLKDGTQVELKFGMGALELFGELIGVQTLEEALARLNPQTTEEGEPIITFAYLGTIRKLLYAAARFAALSQDKPVTFTEYSAANWIEEVGLPEILSVMDMGGKAESDGVEPKKKKQVRPTA